MSAMTREELLWQSLVDEAGEALIEEAASVSVAQAEKELAEAGFDVAAERARAEAFLVSLRGAAAEEAAAPAVANAVEQEAPVSSLRKKRPAGVWMATAAAAAVAAGTAVTYVATRPEDVRPSPTTRPPPATDTTGATAEPVMTAEDLRKRAATACQMGHFEECLSLLDQAADKDPDGDRTPEVQALRKKATTTPERLK
jgi:hypothetical protein